MPHPAATQSPLAAHLETLPGKRDVLRFDTFSEASDAAWKIREEHPDVSVEASCDRVIISLIQEA